MSATMTWIAKAAVITCLVWLVCFPLFGGGSWGKEIFASWANASVFHDKKGGVPILMLTFPILVAGALASLFASPRTVDEPKNKRAGSFLGQRRLPDKETMLLWVLVFFPSLVYILSSAVRKLSPDMSTDEAFMEAGNIFGMLAVVIFSWMLLPVTHKGPLGRLFRWDSIAVIRFHKWGGRIVVVGALLHGLGHTIRFAILKKDVLREFYLPPAGCWKNPQTYVPECDKADGDDKSCTDSCYDHFLPTTGIVALMGLILIGLTSMHKIRRNNFALFARLHYLLTPITFLLICIHYNKTILYASGSLLYYLACTIPAWIEDSSSKSYWFGRQSHVKVVTVEKLNSDDSKDTTQRPCIALTMEASEAAVRRFYPGAYVQLSAPCISKISHPFTVNRVEGQTEQIRVVFRVTGPFTRAMENTLFCRSPTTVPLLAGDGDDDEPEEHQVDMTYHSSTTTFPKLYLDGYYGSGMLRNQVLSHDVSVLVAAGIGITPYLSLLSDLAASSNSIGSSDGLIVDGSHSGTEQQPRQIILHWICRDKSLIDYCRKEYMEFTTNGSCSIKVVIHKTGGDDYEVDDTITPSTKCSGNEFADTSQCGGLPFQISKFAVGETLFDRLRFFVLFSVLSWGGLYCIWLGYKKQAKTEYVHRIYTLVAVMCYELVIGVVANVLVQSCSTRAPARTCCNNSSGNFNDIELSAYKDDKTDLSEPGSEPVVPVEDQSIPPRLDVEISEGRPLLENILEDLVPEQSCAIFSCLPEHMMKQLRVCIDQKGVFDARYNAVAIYKESFEK